MHSRLLQGLDKAGQANVAACVGVDPSTISRKKERKASGKSDFELMCDVLACCGLKIVPQEYQSYSKPHIEAIFLLAQNNLGRAISVDDLFHDELAVSGI